MIKLDVKDYCHACMDFSADVIEPVKYEANDNHIILTDTIIQCEYRRRCEAIRKYLERQTKTEEAVG
jgi:hypothetical protein